jgi:hypothetical protein
MKPPGEVIVLLWRLFVFKPEKERQGYLFYNLKSSVELLNSLFYLQAEQLNIFQKGGRSR